MATAKGSKTLTPTEKTFVKIGLAAPNKTISQIELVTQSGLPLSPAVTDAINSLLRKNLMTMLKTGKGEVLFRFLAKDEVKATGMMDSEEKMVYDLIKEADNKGIWTKNITTRTGLQRTIIAKCLKTLEGKKMIKAVKSVKTPTRKIYMLANVTPSVEITGGPWFTDNELDVEYVDLLKKCTMKLLQEKSIPDKKGIHVYPVSATPFLPTVQDVKEFITTFKISSVELMDEHVEALLDLMIYDGTVEKIMVQNVQRGKGKRKRKDGGGSDSDSSDDEDRPQKKRRKGSKEANGKGKKKVVANGKKGRSLLAASDDSDDSGSDDFDSDEDAETSRAKRKDKGSSKKRRKDRRKRKVASDSDSDVSSSSSSSDGEDEDRKPDVEESGGLKNDYVYRLARPYKPRIGWTDIPCGKCPVESFCTEPSRPLGPHHQKGTSFLGLSSTSSLSGRPKISIEATGVMKGVGMMGGAGAAIGASNERWGDIRGAVGAGVAPVNPKDCVYLKEWLIF
ncbi:hypothetical protein T439DRAFT_343497 [Meredithblackwellia eburnea MCA 4105]